MNITKIGRRLLNLTLYLFILLLLLNVLSFSLLMPFPKIIPQSSNDLYAYGNWAAVGISLLIFSLFVLSYISPLEKKHWKALGIYEAFLVALFTEMYGFPLTIFLLSSFLGLDLSFDHVGGHLSAVLLSKLGVMQINTAWALVMVLSNLLIVVGLILIIKGWKKIYRSNGLLVKDGVYRYMRHPQYTGILLITVGFIVQWPTIITIIMWPILLVSYYRLAKKEEKTLIKEFQDEYLQYVSETPMFLPKLNVFGFISVVMNKLKKLNSR